MAMIAIVSLGLASAVGTLAGFRRRASTRAFMVRLGALVLLIVAASLATTQLSQVLRRRGLPRRRPECQRCWTAPSTRRHRAARSSRPPTVTSPVDLPAATVTVLFRPFPWEARNVNGLIASAEGLLLMGLFVTSGRRLAHLGPYGAAAALPRSMRPAFALVFIVAFSYVGNFGILARQRTQMLPLVLTLIAMYPAARHRTSMFGGRPDRSTPENEPTGEPAVPLA